MAVPGGPQPPDETDNESSLTLLARRRLELQSSSFSSWTAKIPSDIYRESTGNPERRLGQQREAKRSVTVEDTLRSEEEAEEATLSATNKQGTLIKQVSDLVGHSSYRRKSLENSRASNEHKDALLPSNAFPKHPMCASCQDDYLFSRGANFRTGVVTPGHSLQNDSDEQETLQVRPAAEESKWRQKGNQRIGLGLDQLTPTASPPSLDPEVPVQHQIPRKPVGCPPRYVAHRAISSSAPMPCKLKHFQPVDVGNGVPNARSKPFFGQLRASEVANVPATGLRCLPTNSIPSLYPLPNQIRLKTQHGSRPSDKTLRWSGPRSGDPSYPCLRYQKPQIPPRHYHLIQDLQADPRIKGPRRRLRHDIEVVHPPFQPRSLRGRMSNPADVTIPDASHEHNATEDTFTTHLNTISINTDIPIPSCTSRNPLQSKSKPSANTSLSLNRTRPGTGQRPPMPERSNGMTDISQLSQSGTSRHSFSSRDMSGGALVLGHTAPQPSNLTGTSERATDPEHTPAAIESNKMNCPESSVEENLCNMPGSIYTFDGPAEARVSTSDSMKLFPAPIGSKHSERAVTARERSMSGLDENPAVYLEPLLAALLFGLLNLGSCIVQTLGQVLRISYIYSETGNVKMEGTLVLDLLRSMIYTLILATIALALVRVVELVVAVGTGVSWVLKGIVWVLT